MSSSDLDPDDVVISGISGEFPKCQNMAELQSNLFNKKELLTKCSEIWREDHADIPPSLGKTYLWHKFDGEFFDYSPEESDALEPQTRRLLEHAYSAIVDAGVNPHALRGHNTAVLVGTCFTEAESDLMYAENLTPEAAKIFHRRPVWCYRGMVANQISAWLGVTGPSFVSDTACASSLYALSKAYEAILAGECENALVCGANLLVHCGTTIQFCRLGALTRGKSCRPFDVEGDGYVRSEAASVIFLQRARHAKRAYCKIVHVETNSDGYKDGGITFPSRTAQAMLLRSVYSRPNVDARALLYMEVHGTGTLAGDPEELGAIDIVFYKEKRRSDPLLVGSIKSNLGHAEGASGIISLAKLIIALQTQLIPPMIHYNSPRESTVPLKEGHMKVVTSATPLPSDGLLAVSNFGFGGANAHVIVQGLRARPKGIPQKSSLPRLALASGRTEDAVRSLLGVAAAQRPLDDELLALLNGLAAERTPGHPFRGYALLDGDDTEIAPAFVVQRWDAAAQPPLWLAFPAAAGGDPWTAAAHALLPLPAFSAAARRCQAAVQALNTKGACVNGLDGVVGAVVVQVAIAETVRVAGLQIAGAVGEGVGALAAAVAAGRLDAEAAAVAAHWTKRALSDATAGNVTALQAQLVKHLQKAVGGASEAEALAEAVLRPTPLDKQLASRLPGGAALLEVTVGARQTTLPPRAHELHLSTAELHADPLRALLLAIGSLYCAGLQPDVRAIYPEVSYPVSPQTPMIAPHVQWDHSTPRYVMDANRSSPIKSSKMFSIQQHMEEYKFMYGHIIDERALLPATGYLLLVWETYALSKMCSYGQIAVKFENIRFLRATHLPKEFSKVTLTVNIHASTGAFEVSEGTTAVVSGKVRLLRQEERDVLAQQKPPATLTSATASDALCLSSREVYKCLRLRGYNYSGLFRGIHSAAIDGKRCLLRWEENWVSFLDCMLQLSILSTPASSLVVPTAIQSISIDPQCHGSFLREDEGVTVADAWAEDALSAIRAGGVEVRGLRASAIARRRPAGVPVLLRYDLEPYFSLDEEGGADDGEQAEAEAMRVCAQVAVENRPPMRVGAPPLLVLEVLGAGQQPQAPLLVRVLADMPHVQASVKLLLKEGASAPEDECLPEGAAVGRAGELATERDVAFALAHNLVAERDAAAWEAVARVLSPAGCVVTRERGAPPGLDAPELRPARAAGLRLVLARRLQGHSLLMFRKGGWDVEEAQLRVVALPPPEDCFAWLPHLQQALAEAHGHPNRRVVLLAEGQPLSGIQGLFNCLRLEPGPGRENLRCYFVTSTGNEPFSLRSACFRRQLELDLATNVLEDGRWGSFRHVALRGDAGRAPAQHAYNDVALTGDLSSFTWFQGKLDPARSDLPKGEKLIHVYFSALNFRDIMLASGKLSASTLPKKPGQESLMGFEFSGRTPQGRRMMGVSLGASLSNVTAAMEQFTWDVPDHWTLEQAATVPVAYSTVVFALEILGRIRRGESVLVHAGSGGVGQAAIHLALFRGARVFATVGTRDKRDFLLRTFPQLDAEDIGNSRDCSFEQLVMRRTGGRGVDIVLNSLADDKLLASVRCLAPRGRFLEIGKVDMQSDTPLHRTLFTKGRSFHGVLLDKLWVDETDEQRRVQLNRLMKELLSQGAVKPLKSQVFSMNQVEEAFRFMAGGKHIGKVLINIRPEEEAKCVIPEIQPITAITRFHCNEDSTYIIAGGLGGFGLELADWLVGRGARRLVLTSRRGVTNGYQARKMLLWQRHGVQVRIFTGDAASPDGAERLLKEAEAMGSVSAIFNLAVVLRDALLENQTTEAFGESFRCKATATLQLDALSRRLCPHLRHFVLFSSVSCGLGNAGQSNYGFSNSVMERVARARRAAGLPATAVQWGAVGDVGLVADMRDDDQQLEIGGTLQQRISSCLEVLDDFLVQPHPVLLSMVVAEKRLGGRADDLASLVAGILGIRDVKTVSTTTTLADLGLDSILAVEIQQALERNFDILMTPQEVRSLTFDALKEMQTKRNEQQEGQQLNQTPTATATSKSGDMGSLPKMLTFLIPRLAPYEAVHVERVVQLPSLQSTGTAALLLPGVEGVAALMEPLAARLHCPVLCLQLLKSPELTSVHAAARQILQELRSRIVRTGGGGDAFRLVGYSFGGLLALELAALLEEEGLRGAVVLVDSAPDYLKSGLGPKTTDASVDTLERQMVLAYARAFSPNMDPADLESCNTWLERRSVLIANSRQLNLGDDYLGEVLNCIRSTILALVAYRWRPAAGALRSRVTLIRAEQPTFDYDGRADYELGEMTEKPVSVHCVKGVNHYTIMQSPDTSTYINNCFQDQNDVQ